MICKRSKQSNARVRFVMILCLSSSGIRLPWRLWVTSSCTWPTTASTRRTLSTRATVMIKPARDTNGNSQRVRQTLELHQLFRPLTYWRFLIIYVFVKLIVPPFNSFRALKALWEYLGSRGVNTTLIWEKIKDIVIKTIIAYVSREISHWPQSSKDSVWLEVCCNL